MRAIAILLLLTGCAPCRIDAVVQGESLARHHSAVRAGPRLTWANGVEATILGGHQQPLWAPGEPHVSDRAPSDEFQASVEVVIPIR